MLSLAGFGEQVFRSPPQHVDAVSDELLQELLDVEELRPVADKSQQNDAKRVLQRRELEELVEHYLFIGISLKNDVQPHLPFRECPVSQVDNS